MAPRAPCRRHSSRSSARRSSSRLDQVGAGRPDAAGERLPPGVEASDARDSRRASSSRSARSPAASNSSARWPSRVPGQVGLVVDVRVERPRRVPEEPEGSLARRRDPRRTRRRHHPAGSRGHLGQPRDRILHEVNDELREGGIERAVREWQLLGWRPPDIDAWVSLTGSRRRTTRMDRRPPPPAVRAARPARPSARPCRSRRRGRAARDE